MVKNLILAACLFLTLPVIAIPALAQTVEQDGANDGYGLKTDFAERVSLKYNRAIYAEEECADRSFSRHDRLEMDKVIAARMQANSPEVAVGAARLLNLRRVGRDQMSDMIDQEGCEGPNVKKALQFFDDRLADVVAPAPREEPQRTESSADQKSDQ